MADNIEKRLKHIAFIMDGNGRWAKKQGKPREYGHKFGAEVFKTVAKHCAALDIPYVTVYAFSTENWKRPEIEVNTIMRLFSGYLDEIVAHFTEHDMRVRFLGDRSVFPKTLREKMDRAEECSKNGKTVLNIAVKYGARDELLHAFSVLSEKSGEISEQDVSSALYTADCPDPDLIVRTGGEIRLSNFLLWQAAYAELYFTDTLWPDMTERDVDLAVEEFYRRKRRYGGV